MRSFEIQAREAGQRMDKYLLRMLSAASPGFVYKMLRKKNIVLNGKKAAGSEILKEGDEVRLYLSDETFSKFSPEFAAREAVMSGTGACVSDPADMIGEAEKAGAVGSEAPGAGCRISETDKSDAAKSNIGIDVVYEDDDILIFNKPAGLLSQKAGPEDDSANDRMIAYLIKSGQITPEELLTFHPSVCNRLDRNTSGLIIAGKTMRGLQDMSELLRGRELKKYYHALVSGRVEEAQHLCGYLVKDEETNTVRITGDNGSSGDPKKADGSPDGGPERMSPAAGGDRIETAWRPIGYFGDSTLLEIDLITGKSHQIRAHLASIGHPVLGDPKYGDANLNKALKRSTGIRWQLLCACRMEFPDGLVAEIPDPDEFLRAEEWMESCCERK